MKSEADLSEKKRKRLRHEKGITYFDRRLEQNIFFVLTIGLLIYGLLVKFGLFN